MAGFLGIIVSLGSVSGTTTTSLLFSLYQSAFVITFAVGTILYAVGVIFLWEGFKTSSPSMRQFYPSIPSAQQVPFPAPVQSTVAICPACKARVPAETNFCPQCGADLKPKPPRTRLGLGSRMVWNSGFLRVPSKALADGVKSRRFT